MEICKLEHICKEYRMGETIAPLQDLSLTVKQGDFIAVEGPSGIGKSTLLYVLGTLLQSDSGSYHFGDRDVSKMSDREKSELRAREIGFIFQDSVLIQSLTLRENLVFSQEIAHKSQVDPQLVHDFLARFGLADRADYLPYQLSGGQRRRAMAARCLLSSPSLILADEPTNDLDDTWSLEMIRQLQAAAEKGAGIVMVTHNTQWSRYANRLCHLENGRLSDK